MKEEEYLLSVTEYELQNLYTGLTFLLAHINSSSQQSRDDVDDVFGYDYFNKTITNVNQLRDKLVNLHPGS